MKEAPPPSSGQVDAGCAVAVTAVAGKPLLSSRTSRLGRLPPGSPPASTEKLGHTLTTVEFWTFSLQESPGGGQVVGCTGQVLL